MSEASIHQPQSARVSYNRTEKGGKKDTDASTEFQRRRGKSPWYLDRSPTSSLPKIVKQTLRTTLFLDTARSFKPIKVLPPSPLVSPLTSSPTSSPPIALTRHRLPSHASKRRPSPQYSFCTMKSHTHCVNFLIPVGPTSSHCLVARASTSRTTEYTCFPTVSLHKASVSQ